MALKHSFNDAGLFHPGTRHRMTLTPKGTNLFMQVRHADGEPPLRRDLSQTTAIMEGRIGIRHILERAGLLDDVTIARLEAPGNPSAP